jgi:hypothetical protein
MSPPGFIDGRRRHGFARFRAARRAATQRRRRMFTVVESEWRVHRLPSRRAVRYSRNAARRQQPRRFAMPSDFAAAEGLATIVIATVPATIQRIPIKN